MLNGRCYCGAVEYVVEDAFIYAAYCHCSKCRRFTGSAFSAFGGIETDKLALLSRTWWSGPRIERAVDRHHVDPRLAEDRERSALDVGLDERADRGER